MLPIDRSTLAVIARVGDLRVLGTPDKDAYVVEPDVAEHGIARPVVEVYFGDNPVAVACSDDALAAILLDRGALHEAADELAEVKESHAALEARLAELEKLLADARAKTPAELIDALESATDQIEKLEKDLAEARAKIPATAPIATEPEPTDATEPPATAGG